MIDLKARFGAVYRITLDESATIDRRRSHRPWYYRIPCKYGHSYVHGTETLGAFTDRPRVVSRLVAIPGVRIHQRGDCEASVTFPPELTAQVAQLLKARVRRRLSPERRAVVAERLRRLAAIRRSVSHTPE